MGRGSIKRIVDLFMSGHDLRYRGSSVTQTVERQANKAVASGYCDLDASVLVPAARMPASVELVANKGAPNGYCPLVSSLVPTANIPVIAGAVAQVLTGTYLTTTTTTTTIPFDDTIPQQTEGIEVVTLAITPKYATSAIIVEGYVTVSNSASTNGVVAIFKDSDADAVAATMWDRNASAMHTVPILYATGANDTAARTYKLRVGSSSSTLTINGQASVRKYGGVLRCILMITEVAA